MPEYAFVGRSNVGKSSLINMLTGHKHLAKTSGSPGKTQLINHFLINEDWYLVDLPGYGYARVAKTKRAIWSGFMKSYLKDRKNLQCVFLLIDSRHPPQKIDLEFINLLHEIQVSFMLVFTKSDKQASHKTTENIELFTAKMLENWPEHLPTDGSRRIFSASAKKETGKAELLEMIQQKNQNYVPV